MDRIELEQELKALTQEQRSLFSARCALRALPYLVENDSDFTFWRTNANKSKHLVSIFRAINVGFARCKGIELDSVAIGAAYAANAAATKSALIAGVFAASAAYPAAAYFSSAINIATKLGELPYSLAIKNDIKLLSQGQDVVTKKLWAGAPDKWLRLCERFDIVLRSLGLGYWADEYNQWIKGGFDVEKLRLCLEMPQDVIAAGTDAMLLFLSSNGIYGATLSTKQTAPTEAELVNLRVEKEAAEKALLQTQQLLNELSQQKDQNHDDKDKLQQQLEQNQQDLKAKDAALEAADAKIKGFEEYLAQRVTQSIDAIGNSLVNADKEIRVTRSWSYAFKALAIALFVLPLVAVIFRWWDLDPGITAEAGDVARYYAAHIAPIALVFLVATALLRHDAKLIESLRELIAQKQKVEVLTGLYKASQYVYGDNEKSKTLVEKTFEKISDGLIAEVTGAAPKFPEKTAIEKSEIEENDVIKMPLEALNKLLSKLDKS